MRTNIETPTVYLPGHDQGEPQLATSLSAGYDLPAILTRGCVSNDDKRFFNWQGKRQPGEKRVEANRPPVVFENVVAWLQDQKPAEVAKIKTMQAFPSQHLHLTIKPGETIRVPLGIKTAIPEDMQVHLFCRASSAKKEFRLGNCVGVIDADYRDEWFAAIRNSGDAPLVIQHGQRIVQAVYLPRIISSWPDATSLPETERVGGYGSTGDGPLQAPETPAEAPAPVPVTEALDGEMTQQDAVALAETGGTLPDTLAGAIPLNEPAPTTAAGVAVEEMIGEASPAEDAALDAAVDDAIASEQSDLLSGVDTSQDASDQMPADSEAPGEYLEIMLSCGKVRIGPVAKYRPEEHGDMKDADVTSILLREMGVLAPKAMALMTQKLREMNDEAGVDS